MKALSTTFLAFISLTSINSNPLWFTSAAADSSISKPLLSKRIVGGQVLSTPVPYLVSLMYDGTHTCGGVLLSPNIILTAAHCARSTFAPNASLWSAAFNRLDLRKNLKEDGSFDQPIKQIVFHSKFDSKTLANDISIWELSEAVSLKPNMQPALDLDGYFSKPGLTVNVAGWGRSLQNSSNTLERSGQLNQAQMTILNIASCQQFYSSLNNSKEYPVLPDLMQCMGSVEGAKGTCNGDSGGPVITFDAKKRPVVVGIVSWGLPDGCGLKNDPSLNTPIHKMSAWIKDAFIALNQSLPASPNVPSHLKSLGSNGQSTKNLYNFTFILAILLLIT